MKKGPITYILLIKGTPGEGALSVGIQIDATTAISDPASPNVDATAGTSPTSEDDLFYTFIYGTQAQNEVKLNSFDLLPYIGFGSINLSGTVQNLGNRSHKYPNSNLGRWNWAIFR